jgi:hypothetical protein
MAMTAPPKKPVQQPLFAKPFAETKAWPVADAPTGPGTLPPDVYVAWRTLRQIGPKTSQELEKWLLRGRDWSHARVERTVKAVKVCGYVDTDEQGVMTAREETR